MLPALCKILLSHSTENSVVYFRCDVVGQFMEYVARSPVIAEVPAARVAYLGVLTSLASGPQGAQVLVLRRLLQHAFFT